MRATRRGLGKAVAVVALVGVGVTGCGSSGKKDAARKNSAAVDGRQQAGPGNGRVLIILDEAGRLASVDPQTGDRREIAGAFVALGGLAVRSSGLALFQATGKPDEDGEEGEPDGRLVIVDATGGTATPTIALKSKGGEYGDGAGDPEDLPIVAALREAGGGTRFVMIPSTAGTLFVNLEKRSAIDLTETLGAPGEYGTNPRFSRDEKWGIVDLREKGLVLFSTDDPAKRSLIDGGPLGFSADGKTLLVHKTPRDAPGKIWGVPVEGGADVVYAEGDIQPRGLVGNSVLVAEPTTLYLSRKPGDRRPLNIPFDRENDDAYVLPIGTGELGLMFSGDQDDGHWALIDGNEATVTPLPALDKFKVLERNDERIMFTGGYNEEAQVSGTYAIYDLASGQITPAVTWDPAGTKGGFPVPSPDARSVAIPHYREDDTNSRLVVVTPGQGITEVTGGFAGWAPDGSAVIIGRPVGDEPHMFVVDLATKKETDLGVGYGAVWTRS
jgi:hypothetical protein